LKALGIGTDAQTMHSYLGWEQEFFVISADHFKARPDLVNVAGDILEGFAESVEMMFGTFFRREIGCSSTL
jgi:glutamine synthetase type III